MKSGVPQIKTVKFNGNIWRVVPSNLDESLVLDVRNEASKSIEYIRMDLKSFETADLQVNETSWWSNIEAFSECLYISEYLDEKDPTNVKFKMQDSKGEMIEVTEDVIPYFGSRDLKYPYQYETDSDHHKLVSEFLNKNLLLPCEYLEIDDKIILSYYIRSSDSFERYLLLLEDGVKIWEELQDKQMQGFASGSFFVFKRNLYFIRNRNEICIYSI